MSDWLQLNWWQSSEFGLGIVSCWFQNSTQKQFEFWEGRFLLILSFAYQHSSFVMRLNVFWSMKQPVTLFIFGTVVQKHSEMSFFPLLNLPRLKFVALLQNKKCAFHMPQHPSLPLETTGQSVFGKTAAWFLWPWCCQVCNLLSAAMLFCEWMLLHPKPADGVHDHCQCSAS